MKTELKKDLIRNFLSSIESQKKLNQTMREILFEDETNGTSLFCHLNIKFIYDVNKEFERLFDEFIQLHNPNVKDKTLTVRK